MAVETETQVRIEHLRASLAYVEGRVQFVDTKAATFVAVLGGLGAVAGLIPWADILPTDGRLWVIAVLGLGVLAHGVWVGLRLLQVVRPTRSRLPWPQWPLRTFRWLGDRRPGRGPTDRMAERLERWEAKAGRGTGVRGLSSGDHRMSLLWPHPKDRRGWADPDAAAADVRARFVAAADGLTSEAVEQDLRDSLFVALQLASRKYDLYAKASLEMRWLVASVMGFVAAVAVLKLVW